MLTNQEYMYASKPIKAKIISCTDPTYWYKGMEGKTITIREMSWQGGFVECQENGSSVWQGDVEYKGNPKNK